MEARGLHSRRSAEEIVAQNHQIVRMFISAAGALAPLRQVSPSSLTDDDVASLKWVFGDDEAVALIQQARAGAEHPAGDSPTGAR